MIKRQSIPDGKTHTKQNLNFSQLIMMIFALTSGGPFGIEAAVQSGGIFYTLIGLILIPIFYSLPQSLMCSELGSMMPSHHGYIVWAFRAFLNDGTHGQFLGFYNAIGCTLSLAKDIPLYVTVMLFYFQSFLAIHFPNITLTFIHEYLFKFCIILIGALFNILNISNLGSSNLLLMLIVFVPFLLGFIYTLPLQTTSTLLSNEPYTSNNEYQFGLFLSTLFWCHTGWDTVGCLTADIKFTNQSKLFYAFIIAILLDYISYTIPILGAITQKCEENCWDDGYLYTAYNAMNPTIGLLVLFAGFVSNFGIYISELSVQARTFWSLAQPLVLIRDDGKMYVQSNDGSIYDDNMEMLTHHEANAMYFENRIRIGMLPTWLCGSLYMRTGSPVGGVILQSLISCVFIVFDFSFLVQATVVINCVTWCIEMTSFLKLRYSEPNTMRPYKVPGGMVVAWIITVDKIMLVLLLLGSVIYDNPAFILLTSGSFVVSLLWFIAYRYNIKRRENEKKLLNKAMDVVDYGATD